jgi:hypothetical protein
MYVTFIKAKMIKKLRRLRILNLTSKQTIISDFLYNIYLESDNKELDIWIAYLARENGDEKLAQAIEVE